ncbi:hypothetical protein AB3X91_37800 [Paraburkholderia sp. BR14263]|uniref:hypothetical protein n=1 Tax=unclassified Paraburkholderia TaxID=2615204 RepID=UPI0034CE5A0A
MAIFTIKRINTPLFGSVQQGGEPWHAEYSAAGIHTHINIDDHSLDAVCAALGLDGSAATSDAERYVTGRYRECADGMHGTALGDFGEILTYLLLRKDGFEVFRIKSYTNESNDEEEEGRKFPTPDYIVIRDEEPIAYEVKSTEGLQYLALHQTAKRWTYLQPCSSIAVCRKRALPQLGWVAGKFNIQKHKLRQRNGEIVPFPSKAGTAVAVVVFDGRLDQLRGNAKKYKTPADCRKENRDCWTCVPKGQHIEHVTMPNSPGKLSFSGGSNENAIDVLRAYERWKQALDIYDVAAARHTLEKLLGALEGWFGSNETNEPETLRDFWSVYLRDSMRARGMKTNLEMPSSASDLQRYGVAAQGLQDVTETREVEQAAHATMVQEAVASFDHRVKASTEARDSPDRRVTMSMSATVEKLDFWLMSHSWWEGRTIDDEQTSIAVADDLLVLVLEAIGGTPRYKPVRGLQMTELTARVGETTLQFGWSLKQAYVARSVTDRYNDSRKIHPSAWHILLDVLESGDPRAMLTVMRDGRARLRIGREIFQP